MKASQKGMKLNDIRYFRQSRPYTRKRIPKMRLIPEIPGIHGSVINCPEDQISLRSHHRTSGKSRDRCLTLHSDQRSREIAWISYTSDSEDSEDFYRGKEINRNDFPNSSEKINPEKEILIWQPEPADWQSNTAKEAKFETKCETEKEVQVKMELQVAEKNIGVEELEAAVLVTPEVSREPKKEIKREIRHEIPQLCSNKNGSGSEKSFWFRYGGIRKILDFFGHLLGKPEERLDKEAASIAETRLFVDKGVKNFSNETKSTKEDSSMMNREKRSSKWKSAPRRTDTAIKQPENAAFSGLTRQIMNTRDKKLRATLIKHEIRARKLEEENQRYRRILEEKLKTRQMSSPLH